MEISVENGELDQTEGALPEDPLRVFQQEAKQNLMEAADSTQFGYAKLVVTKAEVKRTGRFFQGIQMVTLMLPSLLGLPMEYYRTEVRAQLQLISAHGDTIGTYTGIGRSKVRVAVYHGYSQAKAPRLSDVQALRLALDAIRPQLAGVADTLRQQLLAAGPLQTGEIAGVAEPAEIEQVDITMPEPTDSTRATETMETTEAAKVAEVAQVKTEEVKVEMPAGQTEEGEAKVPEVAQVKEEEAKMEDLKMDEDTADEVTEVQAEPMPIAQTRKVRAEHVRLTAEGKVKRTKKARKARKVREVEEEETEEEVGSFWQ